ncbi:MAG: DUF2442 domain-containing protein [Chitinivibrionia bacterium]|nr:DUF2442 domain-containing protein [Chitinivibrionia bacterium]
MHSLYYKNSKEVITPIKVEALDDYVLRVLFSNSEVKKFDVKPYLQYKMFAPLKDKTFFAQATTNLDTVCWNEKIDIDPEDLYWNGFLETEQK